VFLLFKSITYKWLYGVKVLLTNAFAVQMHYLQVVLLYRSVKVLLTNGFVGWLVGWQGLDKKKELRS
jgi:hypothetical protein